MLYVSPSLLSKPADVSQRLCEDIFEDVCLMLSLFIFPLIRVQVLQSEGILDKINLDLNFIGRCVLYLTVFFVQSLSPTQSEPL